MTRGQIRERRVGERRPGSGPGGIVALALLATLLLSGCGGGSGPRAASTEHGGETELLRGAELDRAFIQGMVPHHQAAIDMANAVVRRGRHQRVRALAQSIISEQQREIDQLTGIARDRFNFSPERSMHGPMGTVMGVPISTDMSKMGEEVARAPNADEAFLQMMIPHHAGAIQMADEEMKNGADDELRSLSQAVIASQAREIGEMQQLLKEVSG